MGAVTGKKTTKEPLQVCILWHMHQPDYRDPVSGQTLMPWTWLHAVKDYGEMLATIEETGVPVTINLVPSLLEQLERYAAGEDHDRWLDLLRRKPAELTQDERHFMLAHFFSANEETQILSQPRYHQLFRQRGQAPDYAVQDFSDQDLLDLQVWFLLAWTGSHLRRNSAHVAELLRQGEHYQPEQKHQLLDVCHAELKRVIDYHRRLEGAEQIEISVTPYAHPILPLLCDLQTAQQPSPGLPLPTADFRHPEDARLQVREGLRTATRIFGQRARGMWPSEGGVSAAAVRIMAEEGALWAATDEDILARSLDGGLVNRRDLYQVYQFNDLPLLFRDRELSDRIGFLYAGWETTGAVADLSKRLVKIAGQAPGGTVAIILDGENCWERYPDNGYPFLRDFYQALLDTPELQPVTVKSAVAAAQPVPLRQLAAGSWIRADFTTWIGHPEKNLAWELLRQARQDTLRDEVDNALEHAEEPLSDLIRELLRAEGSDWLWWYGDEHATTQADIFDRLFRRHLEGLYHLRGMPVPGRLHQAIKPTSKKMTGIEPSARFTPDIDGRIGDFFEWLAAGTLELAVGGAMYASHDSLRRLYYGYDAEKLYFRIDQPELIQRLCGPQGIFEIRLTAKELFHLRYHMTDGSLEIQQQGDGKAVGQAACAKVLELAVPLEVLSLQPGDSMNLSCHALQNGRENGRWPTEGNAHFCYRGQVLDEENWVL